MLSKYLQEEVAKAVEENKSLYKLVTHSDLHAVAMGCCNKILKNFYFKPGERSMAIMELSDYIMEGIEDQQE